MINTARTAAYLLRKYGHLVSDEECKEIVGSADGKKLFESILRYGPPFNGREAQALAIIAGKMDDQHNFDRDGDLWRDDILDLYAQHIHNYEYKYNDEALKVDPNTDTEETHIGPMAQDIEKVNPAAVAEDPKSGYKTVDVGRLALMNAGAIADLARELKELKVG